MSSTHISENLLRRVGPLAAQRYATRHGWNRVNLPPRFSIALYRLAADPTKEVIVPQSPEVGDYVARMADFVSAVANAERRSMNEVLNALIFPSADTVRFGYKSPDTRLGTIALPDGMNLFDAALRAISATTYDIIRPEKFHARMSNPEAEAYIKSCRMGQTEFSSFIVSCICPVEPDSQLQLSASEGDDGEIEAPAFGRQVTERLMESLTQINSFVLADQTDRLVNPEPGDITISGNFFESLLGFPVSAEDTSLYVTTSWDTALPIPSVPDRVDLRHDLFPSLEDVARQLRPSRTASDGRFIAKVSALRGGLNSDNEMEGDAVLNILDDETSLKAKVWLEAVDYNKACDAHKLNQPVAINGTFLRGRKMSQFKTYSDFRIVSLDLVPTISSEQLGINR